MPIVLRERFDVEEHVYTDFIHRYHGSTLLHLNKFHNGMGVVGPANLTYESRWSTVTVTNNIGRSIEIVKSLESLWLYGYRRSTDGNNPWRLVSGYTHDGTFSSLPGQHECLGFDGNYPISTSSINVSRHALNHAITVLDNYAADLNENRTPSNTAKAKKCFIIIVLYFAEALKILPIRDLLCNSFSQSEQVYVDTVKLHFARNWQIISTAFLSGSYSKAFVVKFGIHNANEVKQLLWLAYRKSPSQNLDNVRKNSGPGDPGNGDENGPGDKGMGGSGDGGPKSSGDRGGFRNYMEGDQPRHLVAGSSSRHPRVGRGRSGNLLHLLLKFNPSLGSAEGDLGPQRSNVMDYFRDSKVPRVEYRIDVNTRSGQTNESGYSINPEQYEMSSDRSRISLVKEMNSDLGSLRPHQSYTMKNGKPLDEIGHDHPMLVAQWQDGVTRRDLAIAFTFEEFNKELREVNSKPCTLTERSIIETYVKQEIVPFVMKDAPSCVGRLMKIRDDLCEIQLKLEDKIAQCEMDIQTIRDEEQMMSEAEKIVERWENEISSGQLDASVGCPNPNKKKKFKLRSLCQILDDSCRDNKLALPRYNVHPISNGLYLASATLKSKGVDCMAESELKKNPHEAREHAALLLMQKLNEMEED